MRTIRRLRELIEALAAGLALVLIVGLLLDEE